MVKYKEFKVVRFAYGCEINTVYVPEGVRFYCFKKNRSESSKYSLETLGIKEAWRENWVAVLPWSEDNLRMSHSTGWSFTDSDGNRSADDYYVYQSFNLNYYEVGHKYIIWYLHDIFPIDDNWPETTIMPDISNIYVKYLSTEAKMDLDLLALECKNVRFLNISDEEKEKRIEEKFCPITKIMKVHGFTETGSVDVTIIRLHSWIDASELRCIERRPLEIEHVFNYHDPHENLRFSDSSEYNIELNKMLVLI